MNRHTARVLLVVAGVVCAAAVVLAQAAPRGTVSGSVTGSGGPVVGVKVVITSAVSAYTASSITDKNGGFAFSDAPVGGVEVKAYNPQGNALASAKGTLNFAGEIITVAVKIP